MSGLVAWLAIIVFIVSLNRVFGALGRGMTEEDGPEGGKPPRPGGSGGRGSLREELLREISEVAEREARARAEAGSRSEIHWTAGLGGGAPLGVATRGRTEEAGVRAPQASRAAREPRAPSRAAVAPAWAGSRKTGEGPPASSTPAPARTPVPPGAGQAGGAGAAATLPAWPQRTALQRAILYEAILGPPLALREGREGPPGV